MYSYLSAIVAAIALLSQPTEARWTGNVIVYNLMQNNSLTFEVRLIRPNPAQDKRRLACHCPLPRAGRIFIEPPVCDRRYSVYGGKMAARVLQRNARSGYPGGAISCSGCN